MRFGGIDSGGIHGCIRTDMDRQGAMSWKWWWEIVDRFDGSALRLGFATAAVRGRRSRLLASARRADGISPHPVCLRCAEPNYDEWTGHGLTRP